MKKLLLFGILVANATFIAFNANAQFSSGSGTVADPYVITTASQLNDVRNYLSSSFKLGNDIDLADWITSNSSIDGWLPIGTATTYFTGNFDGDGHFITGFWVNRPTTNSVGLFGVIAGGVTTTIKNLGIKILDNKSVIGQQNVAGIVGLLSNTVASTMLNITSCSVTGTISGTKNVGALLGYNNWSKPTLQNCYVTGSVTSSTDGAGGLMGSSYGGSIILIDKCYANNLISASTTAGSAGGILGGASASTASGINLTISNCVAINATMTSLTGATNRVYGYVKAGAISTLTNNYAFTGTLVNGSVVSTGTATNQNGLNKSRTEIINQSTYGTWDFTTIWQMGNSAYPLPVLKSLSLASQPTTLPSHLDPGIGTELMSIGESNIKISYKAMSSELIVDGNSNMLPVKIYDYQGKLILKSTQSNINISSLNKGLYLVNIGNLTTKIIK